MVFKKGHPYGKRFEKGKYYFTENYIKKGDHRGLKTEFKKGLVPWNKGLSKETDKRVRGISKKLTGRKTGHIPWNKGLGKLGTNKGSFTKETRAKIIYPVKDTLIEVKIQDYLKQLGIEFYIHRYLKEIENTYQCDILIPTQKRISRKTIIECFGNYWHHYPFGREIDIKRCQELREKEWRVIVFWESEIKLMQIDNLKYKLEGEIIQ
jgi:G:T-mismatch repair DNA endonuclease (very short patch repair protein)